MQFVATLAVGVIMSHLKKGKHFVKTSLYFLKMLSTGAHDRGIS